MELANNLKQARLAKNMSQEELAAFIYWQIKKCDFQLGTR